MALSYTDIPQYIRTLSILMLIMTAGCGIDSSQNHDESSLSSGLDRRPPNRVCEAFNPEGSISLILSSQFSNMVFSRPVALLQHPIYDQRWYVVEQSGRIRTLEEGDTDTTDFINISSEIISNGEAGLLGMAFHPNFSDNGEVYLSYTAQGNPLISYISRVISLDDGLTASIGSETILLSIDQPYSNHNGGWIAFGHDNYLYIGLGDGGSGGDPDGNGQDITTLLGAMLRIDVDNGDPLRNKPYSIPQGNPFETSLGCDTGCPEIFAWGLRNPWRWSFDSLTGNLWVGDVGQNANEEIDLITAGGNYGWNTMEGNDCYPPDSSCSSNNLTLPVVAYGRSDGNSVTGGYVYTGTALPTLYGAYIYGDFGSGKIWQLRSDGAGGYENSLLLSSGMNISSFAKGRDGEIYLISYGDGQIYSLTQENNDSIPSRLSETGYLHADDYTQPVDCFIPYDINVSFWSDGAAKDRYFAVPDSQVVDNGRDTNWQLPPGSVALKSFWLNGHPIEMRLLVHHSNGQWAGYTYEWDDKESDYIRVIGGKASVLDGQTWIFPSESDCMRCHPAAAGRTLGFETAQLNRSISYSLTGRTANQLTTFSAIELLSYDISEPVDRLPIYPDILNNQIPIENRAKAYLHANCAQCHRPDGPTPSTMDLRYNTFLSQMSVCNTSVQGISLDIADPLLIAPGEPDRSILLQRMKRRDANGMPPIASSVVDARGTALIEQWITNIIACP